MNFKVQALSPADVQQWDAYVHAHPRATLYHLSGWKNVIEKAYDHKTYYLMALGENQPFNSLDSQPEQPNKPKAPPSISGILPLVHLKHFIFGNTLLSIPFFDLGGILADDEEAEAALVSEAMKLGRRLGVSQIELRHAEPLSWLAHSSKLTADNKEDTSMSHEQSLPRETQSMFNWGAISCATKSHKVRMLLSLPESSEILMKSFKAKLRSQIKKPLKEGLNSKIGGLDLLDDFYNVFCMNMRDLGSPVHSKRLMEEVLTEYPDKARIVMIYKEDMPVACSMVVGFRDILENPWASALREYSRLSPNMLLYWTMLEYACDQGYRHFDFGRSSPDEGTYRFKEQWGSEPNPLHWHYISLDGKPIDEKTSEKSKFEKAIQYWQKLPVGVTRILGPRIRKHIGL